MVSVADSAAVVVGEKVTLSMQLPPEARVLVAGGGTGQPVVPVGMDTVKSEGFVPEVGKLLIVRAELEPLAMVTVCGPLVVLTVWLPKAIVAGVTETTPATEAAENLVTKASWLPPKFGWKAETETGNEPLGEVVAPAR